MLHGPADKLRIGQEHIFVRTMNGVARAGINPRRDWCLYKFEVPTSLLYNGVSCRVKFDNNNCMIECFRTSEDNSNLRTTTGGPE